MADIVGDGMVKVGWVTTLSSLTSPTAVQITAGVDLESFLTQDGLGVDPSTAKVETAALNSTFSTERIGRGSAELALTFKNQGRANPPWTTFASRPTGFLVIRYGVSVSTDWAAAQRVNVWSCAAGDRHDLPYASNEVAKFMVPLHITAAPSIAATVA